MKSLVFGATFLLFSSGLAMAGAAIDSVATDVASEMLVQLEQLPIDQPANEPSRPDQSEMENPVTEEPAMEQPPAEPPSAEQPEVEQPGLEQAPAEQPQPGT